MGHGSVEVNGMSVDNRDRIADDDILLRNSANTVMADHQLSPQNANRQNKPGNTFGSFARFGNEAHGLFQGDKPAPNSRVPTASFNRDSDPALIDSRFAAPAADPLHLSDVGGSKHDLFCPFGLERGSEMSLMRVSQKKERRKKQLMKA